MSRGSSKTNSLKGQPWDWKKEDVLKSEHLASYQNIQKDIKDRLVRIHNSLIVIERIQTFPFVYFLSPDKMAFWQLVYWNSLHMVIVFTHGLVNDTGPDKWTLPKLKDCLETSWVKDEHRTQFRQYVQKAKFDHHVKNIGKRIAKIRTKYVAHRLLDENGHLLIKSVDGVSISELHKFFEAIKKLFNACSFGSYYETRLLDFIDEKTVGGKPIKSHLEQIFELIVKDSCLFNEPDQSYWESAKEYSPKEKVEILSEWRGKLGVSQSGERPGKGTYQCRKCRDNATVVILRKDNEELPKCPCQNCGGTQFDRI